MQLLAVAAQRFLSLIAAVLIVSGCSQNKEQTCLPELDDKQPQYVVSHSGLLYGAIRQNKLDNIKAPALPVMVQNYKRGWIARSKPDGVKVTHLGVTPEAGKHFNGLLLTLAPGTVKKLDRAAPLYCRALIPRENLSSMTSMPIPEKGQFWIYLTKPKLTKTPAANYPILQSEVDEFLTGCIEQGERFKIEDYAEQCIKTTEGWSVHWSNDRVRPVSGKPVQTKPKAVDKLLEKLEGNLYENVRAE